MSRCLLAGFVAVWVLQPFPYGDFLTAAEPGAPDFNREVRPILSAHCFKCHGPDDKVREAGLRLDRRDSATAKLESEATAIVPGQPDKSELVRRIFAEDEGERMPPPAANKVLSAQQKDILRRWIAAGADYAPHWAFVAPKQSPLPSVKRADWPRNPIDHFVLARLEATGLTPSPPADKYTLIRRLYLDLIGLPPTVEEVDAFVAACSPPGADGETERRRDRETAYETVVDKLLDSPHYGERWARRWLDLARYADTNGYEKDRVRTMWPYRDWVIAAINRDLPFDQFTIEQIAGDMLPGATLDQRIATGLHRNTMINEEGGIDPLEFRYYASVDRINTTATVWLGLTLGCAQCHTHKFDPIPHHDYYRLMAFLNNADEPTIDVPQAEIAAKRAEIERQIAEQTASLASKFPQESEHRWLAAALTKTESAGGATAEKLDDGSVRYSGKLPDTDSYTLEFEADASGAMSLRLEALADPMLPSKGPGRTPHGNFVVTEIAISVAPKDKPAETQPVKLVRAEADFAQDTFPPENMFDGKQDTGWAIHGPGEWNVNRAATLHFDQPVAIDGPAVWTVKIDQQYGSQHTLGRLRLSLGQQVAAKDDRPEADRRREHLEKKFAAWLDAKSKEAAKWTLLKPLAARSDVPTLTIEGGDTIFVSGDMTKRDIYDVAYDLAGLKGITAIRLECLPDHRLPKDGPGRIYYEGPFGDFFLSKVTLTPASGVREHPDGAARELHDRSHREADASRSPLIKIASAGHSFANGNNTAAMAIDDDPQTGWSINGGQGRSQWATFALDQPLDTADSLQLHLLFERYYAAGLGKFRVYATTNSHDSTTGDLPTDVENIFALGADERTSEQRERLLSQFLATAPELAAARAEIDKVRKSLPEFPTTLVMQERPAADPRATHVHHRGEFLQPKDAVQAEVLSLFPPLPKDQPHDRLAFARWLVDPANPLVGRVTLNRQWAAFFGRGIVRTTEDFGYQGEPPAHPELLDWLAVELVKQGWSMKRMHKLIVMSATYQQSSAVRPEQLALDPQNKLLARFPRQRLEAEMVRDAALVMSGLFSPKIGGPSVFPPQPASITAEGAYGALGWKVSEGPDRYRRGLYTFAKRTAPYAMFQTFDGPSGETCVARRELSNTPLQALTVLNDAVFLEASQALGKAMTSGPPTQSIEDGVTQLFRRCLSRPPTTDERAALVDYYQAQLVRLRSKELDAAKIAGAGEGDANQRAAWTLTARAIMNLDEAITKE
ncbi:MAG: PSD1 and planctomycete cytochrome C domain-containing protein [Planctomycetaceae bacterium]|nr:PSD1 and planctomycete cytochrome C domain-containing protein [Planctomycetaceae bacterium]